MNRGVKLYQRAKQIIPGGTQLLSKRPEMFLPDGWPSYYTRAKGPFIWDLNGRRYADFVTSGIGACPLGFANRHVDRAVAGAVRNGSMSTLNPPEEVELAELLCHLHPWAKMVRFVRTGGEAMAVAVRIARAASGKDTVLFSGYHGWHDWYLSANLGASDRLDGHLLPGLEPNGVPDALEDTAIGFRFNDVDELKRLYSSRADRIGAIVIETVRNDPPSESMIDQLRRIQSSGVPLVVDEITCGWRLNIGGAHLQYGILPDIAVFAKGMSNGYPLGAIIGTRETMEAAQRTFISSTYWTERIGPTAGLACIRQMEKTQAPVVLAHVGKAVRAAWLRASTDSGLGIDVSGIDPLLHFHFVDDDAQLRRTAFTAMMLDRGFLASGAFYATTAHTDRLIERYGEATGEVFRRLAAMDRNELQSVIPGEVAHSGFARLN